MAEEYLQKRQPNSNKYTQLNPNKSIFINKTSCESFHSLIKRFYGEEIDKQTKKLENVRRKKVSRLCDLTFLKRCRDNKITPNCVKIKHQIRSHQARRILAKASTSLLSERIQFARRELDKLDREGLALHLSLANKLSREHWDTLDRLLVARMEYLHTKISIRQIKKYDNLATKHKTTTFDSNTNTSKLVINLSDTVLSDSAVSVLSKGLNFGIAPPRVPVAEIIAGVESALKNIPEETAEEIRHETVRILKRAKPPKANLMKKEYQALKSMKENKNIVILPADKGKAAVILNKVDYINKAKEILEEAAFIKLEKDPNGASKSLTVKLLNESSLPEEVIKKIKPQDPLMPRFYGLPKIHKTGVPLRPIVNSIGSTTYELCKYLDTYLRPLTGSSSSFIRDSKHFVEMISSLKLSSNDCMVSLDVNSLFTKVPIEDTLKLLKRHFTDDIIKLFKHCLTSSFFIFNGTYYKQIDGVAMGSPISPTIANYFMEDFEHKALETFQYKPKIWLRYVDDIFCIWQHGGTKLQEFLTHLNSQHINITFSMETETDGKLPFLDVLLTKNLDGSLLHTVYRKPTHTNQYINAESHHHPAQKMSTIKTLYKRAENICHPNKLKEEISKLDNIFLRNGYSYRQINRTKRINKPKENALVSISYAVIPYVDKVTDKISRLLAKQKIKTAFTTHKKISQMLYNGKDHIPFQHQGIYKIPCECGKVYIGQTGRTIATRIKEHERCIRLNYPDKSALAEHALRHQHRIKFEDTVTIAKTTQWARRLHREAIEIFITKNNVNKDVGSDISRSWLPILHSLCHDN